MKNLRHRGKRLLDVRFITILLLIMWGGVACLRPPQGNTAVSPPPTPTPALLDEVAAPETTTLLLPTRRPTPIPHPTATYAPQLADWTVMVYLDADNNLELAGLLDLNEMEAAGASQNVNVVVQMDRAAAETDAFGDWQSGRRYLVRPDEDPATISSELVEVLSEVNMGSPITLADFIGWSIDNYPANRYALIIWDHGAGWNGVAFDNNVGVTSEEDHISLTDLEAALEQALAPRAVTKLDVIGFDACLMGQLDVFQAVQPHARYAVASEELTPGLGWDYEALLRHLYDKSGMDGAQLAQQMVRDFMDHYTLVEPDDFVTMSAVDLSHLPDLTYNVEVLASTLAANPTVVAGAVGDARSGAEAFARVYADEFEAYAAVDLHHFASILAQRSSDPLVVEAAEAVMDEVERSVIANEHGLGFRHSGGIAIYFPRTAAYYSPEYGRVTQMSTWPQFLNSYHNVGLAQISLPEVQIANVLRNEVGIQKPAYLDIEIVGRNIANVVLIGGEYLADGRRRLVEYDNLIPEPSRLPDGTEVIEWRDGVHDDFFVWYTDVTYLYDGRGNGDFVIMWPTDYDSTLFSVQGRYRRATADSYFDANLVFDHRTGELTRVWGVQSDATAAPAEILPEAGDEFQLYTFYLNENDEIIRERGLRLFFDETRKLYYEWLPLPNGSYFLGFAAESISGKKTQTFTDLTVDNSVATSGYRAYLDPYLGFQFLYPADWYLPTYEDTLLYTTDRAGTTEIQITTYPNLDSGVQAQTLKAEMLAYFGGVDLLFEDQVTIAGIGGLRTAYGYENEAKNDRTGILLTFVKENLGFVVDVDGPLAQEAQTVEVVENLIRSWEFAQAGVGLQPGAWASLELGNFSVATPSHFVYQPVGQWQRFVADGNTFVALRTEAASIPTQEVLAALVRDAGADVDDFAAELASQRFLLGSVLWERVDFTYTNANGQPIRGLIMARVENGREVVAFAETDAANFDALESNVFLVMIADLNLKSS